MTLKRKIWLASINGFLIAVGLYFGLPSLNSHVPTDSRTPEQVQAIIEKADIEKLRQILKADDENIRADRELASVYRDGLIAASTVAVVIGVVNIILLSFRGRKSETAA